MAGSIKWFDASKGYGFIVPDNGLADVLLHVTCLRAGGYQTAYEGARVHCQVLKRPKGLQAFRILSMDESTAIHPSQLPQRTHVQVTAESDWERAHGEMVQPGSRLRLPDAWRRHAGRLRPHGDAAPLRLHRAASGPDRAGPLGHGLKGCMAAELRPDGVPPGLPPKH